MKRVPPTPIVARVRARYRIESWRLDGVMHELGPFGSHVGGLREPIVVQRTRRIIPCICKSLVAIIINQNSMGASGLNKKLAQLKTISGYLIR